MLFSSTDRSPALDPDVLHETVGRQFWLSLALLLALAFAALGQLRPAGEIQATTGFVHSGVVAPTFAPPPVVRTPPSLGAGVRIG